MPMLLTKLMAAGLGSGLANAFCADTADSQTATGTNQATAFETSTAFVRFTTVASGTGCLLDNGARGDSQFIINAGANALLVYPHIGGSINQLGTNTAFSIPAGSWAAFDRYTDTLWTAANDAASSSFVQYGSAASLSVQEKLRQTKAAVDFITDATIRAAVIAGTNTSDVSTYVQAAIDSLYNIDFQGYTFHCHGITQSNNGQALVSTSGIAKFIKNANGTMLASTGDNVLCQNLNWRGDAASPTFTGAGATFTGANTMIINCGSRWMTGRALKSTGQHTQIYGTCDIYQTTGATSNDYDIEIGVSGTATLYHELHGIYSSQATGGILLTDVGGHTIVGGQFGKLNIAGGTLPAGVNGGKTLGSRILGNVNVSISSAIFVGCEFGAIAITLGVGTTGHKLGADNTFENGYSVTDNSSDSSVVMDTFKGEFIKTWTPADASGAGLSLTIGDAIAYKLGRIAVVSFMVTYPATGNGSQASISGLPFTSANTNNAIGGGGPSFTTSGTAFTMLVGANGTTITFWGVTGGGAVTNANLSGAQVRATLVYRTAT